MNIQKATRNSWKTKPLLEEFRVPLQVKKTFSHKEYDILQLGRIPRNMEDKWFIYLDGDWIFFHRSWTGDCIYQLRLERNNALYSIAEVWGNSQFFPAKQLSDGKDEQSISLLLTLIEQLLLSRNA